METKKEKFARLMDAASSKLNQAEHIINRRQAEDAVDTLIEGVDRLFAAIQVLASSVDFKEEG